ncbi:MAG: 16S rRNA (guanine(527)-N(7))-methyltransferase RsmG [Cyanobacteria bacterium]|nr:16S rRNA (guanine(527)-N(7))-methyltransferase RsmG [Cyanobacteriota bacterium]
MTTVETPAPLSATPLPWQGSLGWQPTEQQCQQFQALYELIWQANQSLNLTRIIEPADFLEKHLWDSLTGLVPWLLSADDQPDWVAQHPIKSVLDIGTGAGLPGFPAAIVQPDWQVTLLDSTQKKVRFLAATAATLALGNVREIADRAEYFGHQLSHREQYDLALLRAVGAPSTCAEYALPLVRKGGIVGLYRGQWSEADTATLAPKLKRLGGAILAVQPWETPLTGGARHCVYLRKVKTTPDEFPRAVGLPAKQPL